MLLYNTHIFSTIHFLARLFGFTNKTKSDFNMDTTNYSKSTKGGQNTLELVPDQKTIKTVINSAKKKLLKTSTIIIARFKWLKRHKLEFPENMELPNLCITVKDGKLIRTFYCNVLTHIIKKQRYYIQILN
jgi:hypothetical protein